MRLQAIYKPASVQISATGEKDSNYKGFKNLQAVISATGKSSDNSIRLQERMPLRPVYDLPEYALDSAEDLCKILVLDSQRGSYVNNITGQSTLPRNCYIRDHSTKPDWRST